MSPAEMVIDGREAIVDPLDRFKESKKNLKEMQERIAPFIKTKKFRHIKRNDVWCDAASL